MLTNSLYLQFHWLFDSATLIVFTVPIILSAYWGGVWTGIVATALSVTLARYYIMPPLRDFAVASYFDQTKLIFLSIGGLLISLICEQLHRERLRAEEGRRAAEAGALTSARLAAIVASSDDAIIGKDLEGNITSWNEGSEMTFGYAAEEMIGRSIRILIPDHLMAEEDLILERLRSGLSVMHYETVRRRKDGSDVFVSISVTPVRDSQGRIVGASKVARDITSKRRAEAHNLQLQQELAHTARLSSMGQMSAAIAHELNQPLTAIMNYTKACQRMLSEGQVTDQNIQLSRETMEKVAQQTIRAGNIIRYLRDFLEKRESPKALEDINIVVEEAMTLSVASTAGSGVVVALKLDPAAPVTRINKIQIQQVLLNLIRNSVEAMAQSRVRELDLSTGTEEPGFVHINVRDTGPGIAPEIASKLFQPFVTTKEDGMGIGLKVCQSIIEAHGGDITLVRDGATGAQFRIRLPLDHAQMDLEEGQDAAALP